MKFLKKALVVATVVGLSAATTPSFTQGLMSMDSKGWFEELLLKIDNAQYRGMAHCAQYSAKLKVDCKLKLLDDLDRVMETLGKATDALGNSNDKSVIVHRNHTHILLERMAVALEAE